MGSWFQKYLLIAGLIIDCISGSDEAVKDMAKLFISSWSGSKERQRGPRHYTVSEDIAHVTFLQLGPTSNFPSFPKNSMKL